MTDSCDMPRCRSEAGVVYIGRGLCLAHWRELADSEADSDRETRLLAILGLVRDDSGAVCEVKR